LQEQKTPFFAKFFINILNEFDKVEHDLTDKLGNKKLLFQKKCEGIAYVATVERGENKIEVRTFWKMRVPGASC
jgi:hypothetical protein